MNEAQDSKCGCCSVVLNCVFTNSYMGNRYLYKKGTYMNFNNIDIPIS